MTRVPEKINRSFLPLDFEISDVAFRVYAALIRHVNDRGEYIHSLTDLGKLCPRTTGKPMAKPQVHRAVSELRYLGLMVNDPKALTLSIRITHEKPENEGLQAGVENLSKNGSVNAQYTESVIPAENGRIGENDQVDVSMDNRSLTESIRIPVIEPEFADFTGDGTVKELGGSNDLFVLRRSIFNNNIINKNLLTKTLDNSEPHANSTSEELVEVPGQVDAFTRKHYPKAPCTVRYCEEYFKGFSERYKIEFDARAAAIDFMETWEHKKDWLYKRRRDPYATQITFDRVKGHLSTWGGNIRKGWKVYPIGGVKNDDPGTAKPEVSAWMLYGQMKQHAEKLRIGAGDSKFYEHNGEKNEAARWRYIGPKPSSKPYFDAVVK